MPNQENCFTAFTQSMSAHTLPKRFTFPFYYQPHPIALAAAEQLQEHLAKQIQWQHNFGLNGNEETAIGKMFGVLVVENNEGELGYLSAFSGKVANSNHLEKFVPPVFDMLEKDSFFLSQQKIINDIHAQIKKLTINPDINQLENQLTEKRKVAEEEITVHREHIIEQRKIRKQQRLDAEQNLSHSEISQLNIQLGLESVADKNKLKWLLHNHEQIIQPIEQKLNQLLAEINNLKHERKTLSASLQQQLFDQYQFLNSKGEEKSLAEIFENTPQKTPPAGAGECAAPKLLHYAFKHKMQPIAMAEFWWGAAPKSAVRQHLNFYAACIGKCQPILNHMLSNTPMDDNPLLTNPAAGKELEIIYQDEAMVIINKPAEFLSVPGKNITDSVYTRMKERFPTASGPLIVHRLDMSTSGLMVIALNKNAHKILQRQFINRTVKKRYIALINGLLEEKEGVISLPLIGDFYDRPRQLVCFENGRPAETKWQVIEPSKDEKLNDKQVQWTRVSLLPKTGRTHQLRVHCAHTLGLNSPIIGDDLYGTSAKRLCLHAESLNLIHPVTKETMHFSCEAEF